MNEQNKRRVIQLKKIFICIYNSIKIANNSKYMIENNRMTSLQLMNSDNSSVFNKKRNINEIILINKTKLLAWLLISI